MVAFAISCGAGSVVRSGRGSSVAVVRPPVTEVLVAREGDDLEARQATVRNMLSSIEDDKEITLAAIRTSDLDSMLVDAIRNVATAVSRETGLDVSVREIAPGDPALLDCTVAFVLGTEDIRQLTPEEAANLGAFMRGGGFLYADVIDSLQENSARVQQLFEDALTPDYYPSLPIPDTTPLYHCYYDFRGAPVRVIVASGGAPTRTVYIDGIYPGFTIDGKLVGLITRQLYINHWAVDNSSEAMKLGVNIVIYNVLRERGVQIRNTPPGEIDTSTIQGTGMPRVRGTNNISVDIQGDGTYLINGEVVAKDELEQVLRATKVPNTEPLTNTLIVSGPGEANQFVRSEEYIYLDSVASSLGIIGRKIVLEDEGPGMPPTLPPSLGIPDMESAPIMLEMLDDGTYLVNGEVVTKDDLGRFSDAFQIKEPGEKQQSQSSDVQSDIAAVTDGVTPVQYQIPADSSMPLVEEEGDTHVVGDISFAVVNDSTYLVDDVEVHRDDLEDVVRGKSFDSLNLKYSLQITFGSYAFLWNTLDRISIEQSGERKYSVLNDLVVDVIDENTVRLAEREMSLTDIEGAIADAIDSDTRYRLVLRADANMSMRTISNVEHAALNNNINGSTKYEAR